MKGTILVSAEWIDERGKHFDIFRSIKEYRRATFRSGCKTLRVKRWNSRNGTWKIIGGSKAMSSYHRNKERARERAMEWQSSFDKENCSWQDLHTAQLYFMKLAVRYGLLEEFTENGIL